MELRKKLEDRVEMHRAYEMQMKLKEEKRAAELEVGWVCFCLLNIVWITCGVKRIQRGRYALNGVLVASGS